MGPHEDPRFAPGNNVMPFDGKRVIFGGFQVLATFESSILTSTA